jgi:hypothetical protein
MNYPAHEGSHGRGFCRFNEEICFHPPVFHSALAETLVFLVTVFGFIVAYGSGAIGFAGAVQP